MPILIKVAPQDLAPAPVSIDVPRTKAGIAEVGERAFVWFAETQGGRGLVARGTIEAIMGNADGTIRIRLHDLAVANRWLGNAQLGPFRNSTELSPQSTLAKKLYRYAHNRAVRLSDDEDAFLTGVVG